jgi:hypothetical protein
VNDEFEYTDHDGDYIRVRLPLVTTKAARSGGVTQVELTAYAARDLAAKLLDWAGPAPLESTCFVDRDGDMWAELEDGTYAVVTERWDGSFLPTVAGGVRPFESASSVYGIDPGTPDYAALAAKFKPGDLAIVSDNPGTEAEPGSGYVMDAFNGKAVSVVSAEDDPYNGADHFGPECVRVALGNGDTNYIHVAHLTRVEAVKW